MKNLPNVLFLSIVSALAVVGCSRNVSEGEAESSEPTPPATPSPAGAPVPTATMSDEGAIELVGLRFTPQPGWIVEPPESNMRAAQMRLPAHEDGFEDAEMVAFYFGEVGAGMVQANLQRWESQFTQPDGSDTRGVAEVSERTVNGLDLIELDVTGTYHGAAMTGAPGGEQGQAGYRMIAVIVPSSEGPYYFKMVGPEAVVDHWEESYESFIQSVQATDG
jgi:hypothetical protein